MADNYNSFPKRTPTIFEHYKLRLETKEVDGSTKPGGVKLGVWENNPRFLIYPNVAGMQPSYTLATTPIYMDVVMQKLKEISQGPVDVSFTMDFLSDFDGRTRVRDKITIGKVVVGKNSSGVTYIAFFIKGMPKPLVSEFKPDQYHGGFIGANHEKLDPSEVSNTIALSWSHVMRNILINYYVTNYVVPAEKKPNPNAGGGGGYSKPAPTTADFSGDVW